MGYGVNLPFTEFLANDGTSATLETLGQTAEGPNGTMFRFCLNDTGAAGVLGRIPCHKTGAKIGNVTFLAANALISAATVGLTLGVPAGVSMCAPPINSFFWVQIRGPSAVAIPTSGAITAGESPVITGAATPTFIAGPSLAANWGTAASVGVALAASSGNSFAAGNVSINVP
jgi:hypothetical protein